jgi:hypothetical protein
MGQASEQVPARPVKKDAMFLRLFHKILHGFVCSDSGAISDNTCFIHTVKPLDWEISPSLGLSVHNHSDELTHIHSQRTGVLELGLRPRTP